MQNLSGKANWLPEEETTVTKELKVVKKRKVTQKVTSEIKKLETINSSLDTKYKQNSDKNLLDAMTSIQMAILALQNLN